MGRKLLACPMTEVNQRLIGQKLVSAQMRPKTGPLPIRRSLRHEHGGLALPAKFCSGR